VLQLHVSLGCATDDLAQAALAHGLQAVVHLEAGGEGRIVVGLEPTRASTITLVSAIAERQ
jgi:hypothetical protein